MKRSTGLRIWSAAAVIAMAALLSGCGGGGGGGGAPAAPRRSNMNVRVEIPRAALGIASDAVISVLSYNASGVATVVASATATITYDEATGKYKGSFSISEIPAGANYICKVSVNGETGTVNLGSLVDITVGVTSDVTITPASTVKALAALYYAHLYGDALSAVSASVELAISTEVNAMIAAATSPLIPDNFINGYYTQEADPFDTANWTVSLETELLSILAGANLLCGNNAIETGEQCDDGNATTEACAYGQTSCTVCDATCQSVAGATSYCGDGTINGSETCDDGNTVSGDGCCSACQSEATAACSAAALSYVATAKSHLFIPSITEADYTAAKTAVTSALTASPNCPDANLVGAFVDLIGEANRIGTYVLANPQTIFPIELSYDAGTTIGARALAPVVGPIVRGLPRTSEGTISGTSTPSEMQAELETNVLPVLTGALTKLNKVKTAAASDTGWLFSYPKDPAYPELGSEYIDKNDVDLLIGVYKLVVAQVKYLLAYNLNLPPGYVSTDPCPEYICDAWGPYGECLSTVIDDSYLALATPNTCIEADTTPTDGIITPTESLPPSPFGAVRTGGVGLTYLAAAKSDMSAGLSLIYTAVTSILSETDPAVAGMGMAAGMIADIEHYKHYVSELAASFGGTATSITMPASDDCWFLQGGYYYWYDVFDPTYNTAELAGCAAHFTTAPAITASIYIGALYDITDFRNVLTNYTIATGEYDMSGLTTILGIFPNGVQESWFVSEVHKSQIGFFAYLYCAVTGDPIISETGGTLTIDGKEIPLSGGYNGELYKPWEPVTTLPVLSEYVTMNEMYGTEATVTVPGYQPATVTFFDWGYFNEHLVLTPLL